MNKWMEMEMVQVWEALLEEMNSEEVSFAWKTMEANFTFPNYMINTKSKSGSETWLDSWKEQAGPTVVLSITMVHFATTS